MVIGAPSAADDEEPRQPARRRRERDERGIRQPLGHEQIESVKGVGQDGISHERGHGCTRRLRVDHRARQLRERLLDAFPGLRAGPDDRRAVLDELPQALVVHFPLRLEIGLVEDDEERHRARDVLRHLVEGVRGLERRTSRAVHDEQIARTRRADTTAAQSGNRPARRCPRASA